MMIGGWVFYWRGWNLQLWRVWDSGRAFNRLYRFGPIGIIDRRIR